jgi:transglutaminase-like putative cysteine protease
MLSEAIVLEKFRRSDEIGWNISTVCARVMLRGGPRPPYYSSDNRSYWLEAFVHMEPAMRINRRELLKGGAAVSVAAVFGDAACAEDAFAPAPGAWRTFQVTTQVQMAVPQGDAQAWVPLPSVNEADWFRSLGNAWKANARTAEMVRDPKYSAEMLHFTWSGETTPVVEVTSRIATRDRAADLSAPGGEPPLSAAERRFYTEGSDLIPVDGIVKATADRITAAAASEIGKARAIYEWVVDNTYRDARVRGCGSGDIVAMLKTGNLGGKCADINALFVGLARASGLPARDIYGIRVAPSKFGYRSLGANTEVITGAQHCRAEVWLAGFGWVAMDPADVRKVALEEPPGNLSLADGRVTAARKTLFSAWEGNWLAYNMAHDVVLPGANGPKVGFLMYPQAETAAGRLDCLDADKLQYRITARELTAA